MSAPDDAVDIRLDEAFILMPFDESFNSVFNSIWNACAILNIQAKRADNIKNGLIMNNIIDGINHAEIIIADITDNRPNVYLELGFALSRRERAVIIISQSIEESEFDVRNWQILQYSMDDLEAFETDLLSRLQLARSLFSEEQLKTLLLTSSSSDKHLIASFLDLLRDMADNNRIINNICRILSENAVPDGLSEAVYHELNNQLLTLADQEDEKYKEIANYVRVLIFSSQVTLNHFFSIIEQLFLSEWFVDSATMKELPHRDVTSKICFRIINMNHKNKDVAITWLMNYLSNKRMGRIDHVRANIANYLIISKDPTLNSAIIKLLDSEESGVLETAIDICGQKRLFNTSDRILTIMNRSSNPFVVRSCIYALCRLGNSNAAKAIYEWMCNNRDKWGSQAVSSNLRTDAAIVLSELDNSYYQLLLEL